MKARRKYAYRKEIVSKSSGKRYILVLTHDDEWQCSCPGWIHRHAECKHIRMEKLMYVKPVSKVTQLVKKERKSKKTGRRAKPGALDWSVSKGG